MSKEPCEYKEETSTFEKRRVKETRIYRKHDEVYKLCQKRPTRTEIDRCIYEKESCA